MNYNQELVSRQNYINDVLEKYLPSENGFQKTVLEAMNYSVRVGGKRLRPIFLRESFVNFQYDGKSIDNKATECIEPFMAAVEMIHTYSLVHDDLPAMDNDLLRRGNPTTHAKFGHAMGVLAGDALLNYSMETALKAFDKPCDGVSCEEWNSRVARALKVLYTKAGIYGMIGGQTLDVEKNGQPLSPEEIDFINDNKTCALIQAPIICGAILGGASDADVEDLERMGQCIGRAFQIKDDILDITADEAVLGKPVGSDEKNGKSNYAVLFGIGKAEEKVKEYSDEAVGIAVKNRGESFLSELILRLVDRKY